MPNSAQGTQYFHIFQAMRKSGDIAQMGPYAFTVYSIIKSYVSQASPEAFPTIEQLCADLGVSKSTIIRSIKTLVDMGYLAKDKQGRSAQYTVQERIPIVDELGNVQSTATWEYIPMYTVDTVNELKELLKGGSDDNDHKYVHIENLQVVISHLESGAVQEVVNGDKNVIQGNSAYDHIKPARNKIVIE